MVSVIVELNLPAAIKHRLTAIAEAGILGRTIDEVVVHFTREALHRDWITMDAQRERASAKPSSPPTVAAPPSPRPAAMTTDSLRESQAKRLLRLPEVCRKIGLGRTTVYRMINEGAFPAPRRLGGSSVAWLESDVDAWIDATAAG